MSIKLSPEARRFDVLHAHADTLRAEAQHLLDLDRAAMALSAALTTRVHALIVRGQLAQLNDRLRWQPLQVDSGQNGV